MYQMFQGATAFNQNISSWNVRNVTDMTNMFNGVTLSTANYDSLLIGWAGLPSLKNAVPFHGGNSTYCTGETARNVTLKTTYAWTITDGGKYCAPPNATLFIIPLGTTNFSIVPDVTNVSAMTLAQDTGSVTWKNNVNVAGLDFDSNVKMGDHFVSLNVPSLHASLDAPANVTITGILCDGFTLYYAAGFYADRGSLIANGSVVATRANLGGNCTDASICKSLSCSDNVLRFEAQHFDGFGGENDNINVPEFSTWLMLVALGITIAGMTYVRRQK
jgi:surface protein